MSPIVKRPRYRTPQLPKREESRRLNGLGLDRHDDPDLRAEGLAIVERFLVDTRRQVCAVSGRRNGDTFPLSGGGMWSVKIEAAHVLQTRGAWCPDFLAVIPLSDWEHTRRPGCEQSNPEYFEERGLDVADLCWRRTVDYLSEHLEDCRWLALNAMDNTLAKLASDVLEGTAKR